MKSLIVLTRFLKKLGLQIILLASLIFFSVLIYGFSRPDLYLSKATLEVGQLLWFSWGNLTVPQILLESPEQIR